VADTPAFATALAPGPLDPDLDPLPRPRLVFQGAIVATKLDVELLTGVARMRPGWSIVLVGPRGAGDPGGDVSALDREPNIHLIGPRPASGLPAVLRGADAGLIPYAINDLTRSVFPMKVYEYLAAGLPVLATPLPALAGVEAVETVDGPAQLVAAAERELAADTPERRRQRSRDAAAHSWEARIGEIERALG
jgi:glycosyltransferase involved in cell wall biosynthesis